MTPWLQPTTLCVCVARELGAADRNTQSITSFPLQCLKQTQEQKCEIGKLSRRVDDEVNTDFV